MEEYRATSAYMAADESLPFMFLGSFFASAAPHAWLTRSERVIPQLLCDDE